MRDGLAVLHLSAALSGMGFEIGGAILNVPTHLQSHTAPPCPVELKETDILLQAPRPPLDDAEDGPNRRIARSGFPAETAAHAAARRSFERCDRETVLLDPNLKADGAGGHVVEEYRSVKCYQTNGSLVDKLGFRLQARRPSEENLTIGYVLSVPPAACGDARAGFRILLCRGMGGMEKRYLSYLLSHLEPFRACLRAAVQGMEPRLFTIPFLVPQCVPRPLLSVSTDAVRPRLENAGIITWMRTTS